MTQVSSPPPPNNRYNRPNRIFRWTPLGVGDRAESLIEKVLPAGQNCDSARALKSEAVTQKVNSTGRRE